MITCHYCGELIAPNSEAVWEHTKPHYAEIENNSQKHEKSHKTKLPVKRDLRLKSAIIAKM